jgi:hypothetical protein
MKKHLDAKGMGEFSYDYKNDLIIFKTKNRNYKKSVEFQNFIADIDEEGFVTGMRIFDASKVFGLDKYALKNITYMEFTSNVENNVITITCKFISKIRNKLSPEHFTQHLTQESPIEMADSSVGPVKAEA